MKSVHWEHPYTATDAAGKAALRNLVQKGRADRAKAAELTRARDRREEGRKGSR
jgi:hypothetical protein